MLDQKKKKSKLLKSRYNTIPFLLKRVTHFYKCLRMGVYIQVHICRLTYDYAIKTHGLTYEYEKSWK